MLVCLVMAMGPPSTYVTEQAAEESSAAATSQVLSVHYRLLSLQEVAHGSLTLQLQALNFAHRLHIVKCVQSQRSVDAGKHSLHEPPYPDEHL
jgi:hypothetical protein